MDPDRGRRLEIRGTPEVFARGQGGLLDVEVHPDYAENGWIYLSYSDPSRSGERGMTAIVRGRLRGDRWIDEETVFRAPGEFYEGARLHFGTRLVFHGPYLFFTIGDRGRQRQAQDLSRPNGKTHRIHHDGRIPEDNPFVDRDDAFPTIWTYGNRNAQGLALDPSTGNLWETEHGPRGGDELNLLRAGANYGWPVVTFGMNYNGTPITDRTSAPGMVDPVVQWTPSLAVCGLAFYGADRFPEWTGSLLSGGLASQELRLLVLDGEEVVDQPVLVEGKGRVRDVVVGPDGLPYVVFNRPGRIVRMVPVE
jgi:glucose/arabinose dehydrogenase